MNTDVRSPDVRVGILGHVIVYPEISGEIPFIVLIVLGLAMIRPCTYTY